MSDLENGALVGDKGDMLTNGGTGGGGMLDAIMKYKANPPEVKRRIRALKKLHFEQLTVERQFYHEVHALEMKYQVEYGKIFDKRFNIVKGDKEPNDEECDWPESESDDEEEEGGGGGAITKANAGAATTVSPAGNAATDNNPANGIPEFWLNCMMNSAIIADWIQDNDVKILKYLEDIRLVFSQKPEGFALEFQFAPNEFFTNRVLTKTQTYTDTIDREKMAEWDGPEVSGCTGCTIDWNPGKDVTVKVVKKKQKKGGGKPTTKVVKADSFFNFFSPPVLDETANDSEEVEEKLDEHYELASYIKDILIPKAVLVFTGEVNDDDDEEFADYDDDEFDDEEEEGPVVKSKGKNANNAGSGGGQPTECQQQ